MGRDQFYKEFHMILERCGCRNLTPYSCRHTTATALATKKYCAVCYSAGNETHKIFYYTAVYSYRYRFHEKSSKQAINKCAIECAIENFLHNLPPFFRKRKKHRKACKRLNGALCLRAIKKIFFRFWLMDLNPRTRQDKCKGQGGQHR